MDIKALKPKDKVGGKKMPKLLKILIIVLIIVALGAGAYLLLNKYGVIKTVQLAWQMQSQQMADQKVLDKLGKILELPKDVTPTMAVVTDAEKLKEAQPFLANAKNGDRLIIYPDMAILYDTDANKIMKVGPVNITSTPEATPVNFAVYNSLTSDPSNAKTAEMETKIKTAFNNAAVTIKANTAKADYPETLVVDIAGNNPNIQKIADALGAKLSGLPIGEKKPEGVAVLVIIGKQ